MGQKIGKCQLRPEFQNSLILDMALLSKLQENIQKCRKVNRGKSYNCTSIVFNDVAGFFISNEYDEKKVTSLLFEVLDTDGDDTIDLLEFYIVMVFLSTISRPKKIELIFNTYNFQQKERISVALLFIMISSLTSGLSKLADTPSPSPIVCQSQILLILGLNIEQSRRKMRKILNKGVSIEMVAEYMYSSSSVQTWFDYFNLTATGRISTDRYEETQNASAIVRQIQRLSHKVSLLTVEISDRSSELVNEICEYQKQQLRHEITIDTFRKRSKEVLKNLENELEMEVADRIFFRDKLTHLKRGINFSKRDILEVKEAIETLNNTAYIPGSKLSSTVQARREAMRLLEIWSACQIAEQFTRRPTNQAEYLITEENSNPRPPVKGVIIPPDVNLKLSWIYGYDGSLGMWHNVRYNKKHDIVYTAAQIGVALDKAAWSQKHMISHSHKISAYTMHPNRIDIATGEFGEYPSILIWSSLFPKVPKIHLSGFHTVGVGNLAFSPCGKLLISIGKDPLQHIAVYEWEKELIVFATPTTSCRINGVISCSSRSFITYGEDHLCFWKEKPTACMF